MKLKDKIEKSSKIQKLKQYKESFDILWHDPKSHALISLSFWLVLIFIFALFVRINNEQPARDNYIFEASSNGVKNYLSRVKSYRLHITSSDYIFDIVDVSSKRLINYNGNKYYYDGNLYLVTDDGMIKYDDEVLEFFNYLSIYNIYDLIKNYDENYIINYKDNSYLVNYSIPNEVFNDVNFIDISFSGFNSVDKIEIDFSENYGKIVIELSNVNSIDKLDFLEE